MTTARRLHIGRLQAVFGETFVVLPLFAPANAAELETALGDSAEVQDGDPLAVVTWYMRAGRVREGVERLETVVRYAEALGTGEQLNLRVAQLPCADRTIDGSACHWSRSDRCRRRGSRSSCSRHRRST